MLFTWEMLEFLPWKYWRIWVRCHALKKIQSNVKSYRKYRHVDLVSSLLFLVATLLNQMASQKFPNQDVLIGLLGFVFVLSGLPTTVVAGIWLDRTLAYKRGAIFLLSTSFLAMVALTITLEFAHSIYGLFLILAVLGFCSTSFLPLGFEFAAEITYPVPEGTSAGILNASAQCFGIFFIVLIGSLVERAGAVVGNLVLSGALLLGVGLLPLVRADLQRRSVDMYGDECIDVNLPDPEDRYGSSYQQIPLVVSD